MYCSKCGHRVSDDALFCQRCGAQIYKVEANNTYVQPRNNSTELDREALKIYLGDVLSLECIKAQLEKQIVDLNREITNLNGNNYYQRYPVSSNNSYAYIHLFFDGERCYLAYVDDSYGGVYLNQYLNTDPNYRCFRWMPVEGNLKSLKFSSEWRYAALSIGGFFDNLSRKSEAKEKFFQVYEKFKVAAPVQYKANLREINELKKVQRGVEEELDEARRLLGKAYAVNIIPESFRNKLYAIYYLHSFICTSNESLTTALLHCDLDEIKMKLDKIIQQQQAIIIQQAVMTAQNQQLLQQNKMQLEHLARIESNTDRAAQYAEIAANNAEACAWIGIANYVELRNARK